MSLESDVFDALSPLVGDRAYPDTFPQKEGAPNPWPALRYSFISVVPGQSICGTGGDAESDFRIQIDGVAATGAARDILRLGVLAAMTAFPLPNVCEGWSNSYDTEVKGYRVQLDFLVEPSSA